MSEFVLPRGRLILPSRKLLLERPLYVARRDYDREIRDVIGKRVGRMGDTALVYQTVPTAVAGQAIRWFDTTGNIECVIDGTGKSYGRTTNGSIASQGAGFAVDTWVTGSDLRIPSFGMQVRSLFEWTLSASKTAAGVATPSYVIRIGANRTTADTARMTLTGPAQTAIADIGTLIIRVIVRAVGGASGVLQGTAWWDHRGTAASTTVGGVGFANDGSGHVENTAAAFDNTPAAMAGLYVSLSMNGGLSAAWTVTQVCADVNW